MAKKDRDLEYKSKKDNSEVIKSKKEMLKKEFLKKTMKQNNSKDSQEDSMERKIDNEDKYKSTIALLKEDISKSKRLVEIEKEKRRNLKSEYNKLEKKYNKVCNDLAFFKDENNELKINIEEKNNKILKLNEKIEGYNSEISELENSILPLKSEIKEKSEQIQSLAAKLKHRESLLQELQIELELGEKQKRINELEENNNELEKVNKFLKFDKNILEQRIKIQEDAIKVFSEKKIASNNKKKKFKILDTILKWFEFTRNDLKYRIRVYKRNKYHKNIKESIVFGVLKLDGLKYKFISLTDGKEYKVNNRSLIIRNHGRDNAGCMANITNDGYAIVLKIYKTNELLEKDKARENKRKEKTKEYKIKEKGFTGDVENTTNIYNYSPTILVITSKNMKARISRMKKVGLKISVFDSYSENAKRLEDIIGRYDIIIYCINHSKHYCNDIIKRQPDYSRNSLKYNFVSDDSKENMLLIIDRYLKNKVTLSTSKD